MTRGVNNVDAVLVPLTGGGSRGDGNSSLLLLHHPVHGSIAIMDFTHSVHAASVIEDTLGRRRLARVNVGGDADVPRFFNAMLSGQL